MALNENGSSWLLDLENALEEECATNNPSTCTMGECVPDSMRSEVWQICLDVQNKGNKLLFFNEIFDLPQQRLLRKDCQCFVEKLGNEEEDKVSVVSDLESLLTFYSKTSAQEYESGNGWIEILLPLMSLKLPLEDTYNLFEAVRNVFIPRNEGRNGLTFHLFRLLLLYHDPELCSFLDTKRITPDRYCVTWFQSLFAATCSLPVVLRMWDIYFQQRDPFLLFFLSLVMVMNGRDQILNLKNEDNQTIIDTLTSMPCALEVEDVPDFCSLAKYYALKTPASFRTDLGDELFGIERSVDVAEYISQSLCLPVNVRELIDNTKLSMELDQGKSVRFFLIDCRPAEQYNAGHLPTAFHLDSHLMLQEPSAFTTAVQGLLSAQRQSLAARSAAGGEHLCFLGSGRMEEDQYTHMVIASFLQKHTHYVSMLHGGYQAIHEYFGEEVNLHLTEHKLSKCLACIPLQKDNTSLNSVQLNSGTYFLGKISAAMKLKSAAVKGRLIDYIVSPVATNAIDRHVSSSDKLEKRYRNIAPVFSIDDEQDPDLMGQLSPAKEESHDIVPLSVWLKKPEVIESFKCHEVKVNGHMFESNLLVTKSHIYVLRSIPGRRDYAQIKVRRPLSTIVKITSKKKHPEIITFKYGVPEGDSLVVSDLDKFVIPNAAEATQLISQQILEHLKSKEI